MNMVNKRYGLDEGEKVFKHKVFSKRWGLSGKLYMLVKKEREIVPIEMKYTNIRPGLNHKYQLVAYMILLDDEFQLPVRKGIIHIIIINELRQKFIEKRMIK